MARPAGPKTRCNGLWTEAKFNSFIKNQLRAASRKWAPINTCKKKAWVRRGVYKCGCCGEEVPLTVQNGKKRQNNVFVDHIDPIVPVEGWIDWDSCINRMFCEEDELQLICKECHDEKSKEEAAQRAFFRAERKVVGASERDAGPK